MGTLPGKKFVWLKAEGASDLPEEVARINPKYSKLLELEEGEELEATYKTKSVVAKVEFSDSVATGKILLNPKHLEGVDPGTPYLVMKFGEEEEEEE